MEFSPLTKRVFILSGIFVAACTPTQADINQYTFKCFESGSTTNAVNTKLAGVPFNITLVSYKNGAITSLSTDIINQLGTMTLGFVETTTQSSCEGAPVSSLLNDAVTPALNLVGGQSSFNISGVRINNAHKNVMCRVNLSGYNPKCSDSSFAVRPASFTVTSVANADNAGTNANAGSTGAGNLIKAGANFSISAVTGVVGYNGTPTLNLTSIQAHSGATQAGILTGTLPAANSANGTATGTNFTYNEVGYFRLLANAIVDNTFTSTDKDNSRCIANSSSNVLSSGKYGCNIANASNSNYIGRFIPNGFKATPVSVAEGCDAGNFTYFGGQLTGRFTLDAVNTNDVITRNYAGNFAKFKDSVATTFGNYQVQNVGLNSGSSTLRFEQMGAPSMDLAGWVNGRAAFNLPMRVSTTTIKTAGPPVEYYDRPLSPVVAQNVSIAAMPRDGEAETATATTIVDNTQFRYGRLSVANAYGAETMPLTFDVLAQHFDNAGKWVTNSLDNCTQIAANTFSTDFPVSTGNNLTLGETLLTKVTDFSAGKAKYKLDAPGHGNNGWVLINTPTLTEFGGTKQMRASFGQYKSSLIYSREN